MILTAGVPALSEYLKVKASSKRTSRTRRSVSRKSSSVSPGNPTMISVVMANSGMAWRRRSTQAR